MKMEENPALIEVSNEFESINKKCAEESDELDGKITNNDITADLETNINKPSNEPGLNSMDIMTQEDAIDKFLDADNKNEFNDDLLLENIDNDNEGINFKAENVIMECIDIEVKPEYAESESETADETVENGNGHFSYIRDSPINYIAKTLKRRSIKCLNKMRIMEDVREGCNIQPSSPGHAEQRTNNGETSKDNHTENGYCKNEDESKSNTNLQEEDEEFKSVKEEDEKKKDEENDEVVSENEKQESQDSNHVLNNDESYSNESSSENNQSSKRKCENFDSAVKKLRLEIEDNFAYRDKIINDYLEMTDCNNIDQIQVHSDQILAEIKTLNDLAREKEREWNNIIHLKKLKEELLLRMQRRKQILILSDKNDGEYLESQSDYNSGCVKNLISNQSILKANLINPQKHKSLSQNKFKNILPRPPQQSGNSFDMNGGLDFRTGRQRPVLDVQSIIADYRQRHPEIVPRRGRRIRNNHNSDSKMSNNGVMNFSSLSLGSGAQVRQNLQGLDVNSELGMLLSAMEGSRQDNSRPTSADSNPIGPTSFKDMLVEFAKLSQSERNELLQNIKPPPPYPEVTVHPVPTTTVTAPPTNSLLHGILTKSPTKSNSKSSFSPTLARLLTAPERAAAGHATSTPTISSTAVNPGNMSISEILSTSKARNEITITPVGQSFDASSKSNRQVDEEEAEDSADRLVIDESTENLDARRGDSNSDAGDEVPQCQGCNQKPAQFVCAGCGNQWYCSRDCQVSAWDEHSEVCSG